MTPYDAFPAGFQVAGRFVIDTRLGHGQFAAVYKALDSTTATHVALKVLNPRFAEDPIATERFAREVTILRRLQHPNIVKVYDVFRDDPWSIICMEWFDGSDCRSYLDRNGPLPVAEFLPVAQTIVSALQACHRLKIVHRDLKPQNVLMNARQELKLVDFGMSRMQTMPDLTRTGTVVGTPQYLPPEMFRSTRADPRSDIYAVGAIFYELLTDHPPYRAQTLAEVMTQQLREDIEELSVFRQDVPTWLGEIVRRCLRTEPAHRYQSCYELLHDLELRKRAAGRPAAERLSCAHCPAVLIPGLPFCHQCGRLREWLFEPGRSSVLLQRCDQPKALQTHLQHTFPAVKPDVAAKVARPPVVMLRGVSTSTAQTMVHHFAGLPCELRVTERLATAMEMPMLYAGLAVAVIVALFCTARDPTPAARVAMIVVAEVLVLGLYWVRTQPLIKPPSRRGTSTTARTDPVVLGMLQELKGLNDAGLKTILGNIMRSFLGLRDRLRCAPVVLEVDTITRAVTAALHAARHLEAQEVYLASTNVNELHARLRSLDARLAVPVAADDAEPLITTKTNVARDLKNYYEVQDAHAATYVALVNLQGVLQRIEDGLGTVAGATDAVAELHGLEEDLAGRPPHA